MKLLGRLAKQRLKQVSKEERVAAANAAKKEERDKAKAKEELGIAEEPKKGKAKKK